MRGFFDLLPVFIILFVVISIIRGVVKTLGRITPASQQGGREAEFDPAEAERTRRIQEEIRRKIAERRAQGAGAPMSVEPPVMPAPATESALEAPARTATNDTSELERQNKLAEELREVTMGKLLRQRKAEAKAAATAEADALQLAAQANRRAVLESLQQPATVRQAFLLREILDRPVGLR